MKIIVAGRLNGVDIARTEKLVQGKVPLQTLRSDIDYSRGVAQTIYGMIGIKVWNYKGVYFDKKAKEKSDIKRPTKTVRLFSKGQAKIQDLGENSKTKNKTK